MYKNVKYKLAVNVIGEYRNVRRCMNTNTHMQVILTRMQIHGPYDSAAHMSNDTLRDTR